MQRRDAMKLLGLAAGATALPVQAAEPFALHYSLSSAMYGTWKLADILPELAKTRSEVIDIWCKVHGNQREQIDAMGEEAFAALLKTHGARLGISTRYPLGPYGLQEELKFVSRLGGKIVLCGSAADFGREPVGEDAKKGIQGFLEKMKPHLAVAEAQGVKISIENHDKQLLYTPDSIKYFAEFNTSAFLGVAFAPHHCYRFPDQIPSLIEALGPNVAFVYAQEHSEAMRTKGPKHEEMMQLPGFGTLDYVPIVRALKKIHYSGWIEPFMHPVPRGIPILPTIDEVTAAINFSRAYLQRCTAQVNAE
ncbi:MAG: sugar phosphate isomerase/epimerase [Candidatus Omnitrophota bacterium]|jgi:sugar phosphate isomerase/epimerase